MEEKAHLIEIYRGSQYETVAVIAYTRDGAMEKLRNMLIGTGEYRLVYDRCAILWT